MDALSDSLIVSGRDGEVIAKRARAPALTSTAAESDAPVMSFLHVIFTQPTRPAMYTAEWPFATRDPADGFRDQLAFQLEFTLSFASLPTIVNASLFPEAIGSGSSGSIEMLTPGPADTTIDALHPTWGPAEARMTIVSSAYVWLSS